MTSWSQSPVYLDLRYRIVVDPASHLSKNLDRTFYPPVYSPSSTLDYIADTKQRSTNPYKLKSCCYSWKVNICVHFAARCSLGFCSGLSHNLVFD